MRVAFSLTPSVMSRALRRDGSPGHRPAALRRAGAILPFLRRQDAEGCAGGVGPALSPSLLGALATKQSILFFLSMHGLLRGACHRARIRATRWLAMTLKYPPDTSKIAKSFSVYPNGDGATASL